MPVSSLYFKATPLQYLCKCVMLKWINKIKYTVGMLLYLLPRYHH